MKIYSLNSETDFITSIKTDDNISINYIVEQLNLDLDLEIHSWADIGEDIKLYSKTGVYYLTLECVEKMICF